jgi:hypothetical protein
LYSVIDVIEEKLPAWDVILFVCVIYIPIFREIYMALSVADIFTLGIAFITACIAFVTYRVAVKSHDTAREAIRFSKLQLNTELCLKLYELKDLTENNNGGLLLPRFFSNQITDKDQSLLYTIKDKARALIQKEKLAEQMVNMCDFLLGYSDSCLKLTINSQKRNYMSKELVRCAKSGQESDAYYKALHESVESTILEVIKELKK